MQYNSFNLALGILGAIQPIGFWIVYLGKSEHDFIQFFSVYLTSVFWLTLALFIAKQK